MHDESGPQQPQGMASLSVRELAWLWAILALALLLRLPGIGWGLPPATPEMAASEIRGSYAFDEEKILKSLLRTDPAKFDLNPELYDWGTLHLEVLLAVLEASHKLGFLDHPWRVAFREMIPGDFQKVYVIGRLTSVAADLGTIFLVFLLGLHVSNPRVGLWAAAFSSCSPGQVLASSQIRVDITAMALISLTALLGLRTLTQNRHRHWMLLGIVAGLAIAAKYSSALVVICIAATALWNSGSRPAASRWLFLGMFLGFILGQPFVLTSPLEVIKQVSGIAWTTWRVPEASAIQAPLLLGEHLASLARFSLGLPVALLSVWGVWLLSRERTPAARLLLFAIVAGLVTLIPLVWPLMRYQLPLIPFCALTAAFGLQRFSRPWRWALGLAALGTAFAASAAQVHFKMSPHPANLALSVVQKAVPAGQAVARIMPELPPLDESVYPMGPDLFADDLAKDPPPWVVTADLPIVEYPPENRRLLETKYKQIAVFRSQRIFSWATLGEAGAPHDWKYTHPTLILYHLR